MKELMRLERKRIGKEFNEVGENHTNLERQFAHNKSDLERKGIKEKSKKSMEINSLQNSIKDAEKKVSQRSKFAKNPKSS